MQWFTLSAHNKKVAGWFPSPKVLLSGVCMSFPCDPGHIWWGQAKI